MNERAREPFRMRRQTVYRDVELMPTRKGQPPPSLKYFNQPQK
jgi:hypothetical protein